jgi:hypothetical protein
MDQPGHTPPRLISTLREDITRGGFLGSFKQEAREIEEFFLSDREKEQLRSKGWIWRWFVLAWWVLKNSLLKLTSFRRILLVIGLVLIFTIDLSITVGTQVSINYKGLGAICVLLVLVLELKDKLLARNELESGRAVQRAMQPDASPSVPGWDLWLYTRSANEVGGDLVDFLRLDGGRCAVAIGDVAGKGLGAALFMVKIQSTVRALAPDFESVDRLAAKLNAILLRDGMPGKFASLFFGRFGPGSGDLQFFNAGHMPPLVLSADGIEELSKGNAALGLSAGTVFETRVVRLAAGESMVVYSDGVTEAQNEAGEFYGLDRFRTVCKEDRMMAAQALGEKILAGIVAFEGNARRTDDLSLVILQRTA